MLFVSDLVNVRYLTGFTGTNGACLIGETERIFFTDFRYAERAEQEVGAEWERPEAERELIPQIADRMRGRVGFEDAKLSVRQLARIEAATADDDRPRPGWRPGRAAARREGAGEARGDRRVRRALRRRLPLGDRARPGGQDRAGSRPRLRGADPGLGAEPSFPPIVAGAANGALPHAEPGEREIGSGELVVFDMGAELDGYCSDCTRTYATGDPGDEARELYELVLRAQKAALDAIRPGAGGKEVDAVPREMIAEAGHGDRFGHGTGHGVGLEVHEAPRLATTSEDDLAEGNVVTVEPGVYLPGRFGVGSRTSWS